MSVAIVSILQFEFGDFSIRIKQKTLSYRPAISPARHYKDTFSFLQCNALMRIFFLRGKKRNNLPQMLPPVQQAVIKFTFNSKLLQIICNSRAVLQTPKRFKKTSARFGPNASAFLKNVVIFFSCGSMIIKSLRLHLPEQPQTYFMMFVFTN